MGLLYGLASAWVPAYPSATVPRQPLALARSSCTGLLVKADETLCHNLGSTIQTKKTNPGALRARFVMSAKHLVNQMIHFSHTLRQYKVLIYCKCCGLLAGSEIHKLSLRCGLPGLYWSQNITHISEDRLPYGISSRPSEGLGPGLSLGHGTLAAASSSSP